MDNTVLPPYAPHLLLDLTTIRLLPLILSVPHPVHLIHFATSFPYLNPAHLNPPLPQFDEFQMYPWIPADVPTLTHYSRIILSLLTVDVPAHTLTFFFYIWADPATQLVLCRDIRILSGSWTTFCELLIDAFPHQVSLSCTEISDTITVIRRALHDHRLTRDNYETAMYRFCTVYHISHEKELLPAEEFLDLTDALTHPAPADTPTREHSGQALALTEMICLQSSLLTEHLQDLQIHIFNITMHLLDNRWMPESSEVVLDQAASCINVLADIQNLSCCVLTTHLPAMIPAELPNSTRNPGTTPNPVPYLPDMPVTTAPNTHPGSPGFPTAAFSFVPPWEM